MEHCTPDQKGFQEYKGFNIDRLLVLGIYCSQRTKSKRTSLFLLGASHHSAALPRLYQFCCPMDQNSSMNLFFESICEVKVMK